MEFHELSPSRHINDISSIIRSNGIASIIRSNGIAPIEMINGVQTNAFQDYALAYFHHWQFMTCFHHDYTLAKKPNFANDFAWVVSIHRDYQFHQLYSGVQFRQWHFMSCLDRDYHCNFMTCLNHDYTLAKTNKGIAYIEIIPFCFVFHFLHFFVFGFLLFWSLALFPCHFGL